MTSNVKNQHRARWALLGPGSSAPLGETARISRAPSINRFFNRDLSWLNFNERVLAETADPSVPALDRLRFAAIASSNLDEFFMVRAAEIDRIARISPARRLGPDGISASRLVSEIRERVIRQKAAQASALSGILKTLGAHGIRIYADFSGLRGADRLITPRLPKILHIMRRSSDPAPPLSGENLYVFIRFSSEYAILSMPREDRLLTLPAIHGTRRFALAERWLAARAAKLFPGREVIESFAFKIIRAADIRYRPDDEDSIEEQIALGVERRARAKVVRLEVDASAYTEGVLFLATSLGVSPSGLYRFDSPLDLRTLAKLHSLPTKTRLRYRPVAPRMPVPLRRDRGLFSAIRSQDILFHHPYDSFEPVTDFLRRAARDPRVTRIYHAMYRTSRKSPIMEALKEAAARGKKVTAYVEIKARFDELNNLRWAQELRRAGARVVRPLGHLKVHSKVTQVFRQEGADEVSYVHLGTGNYHPGTALQYTDIGLLTADRGLGADIARYFSILTGKSSAPRFREILTAPQGLRRRMLELIQDEIRVQKSGGRGRIIGKMNSLVDSDIISALYAASQAGVKIDLLIRGICCLRPGIGGLSENIRVTSVIDRFLEHSRVYYFRAGGLEKIYLSSADWMPRNFYARFEIAFPVKDPVLKRFIRDIILGVSLSDNAKAWTLKTDGTYERIASKAKTRAVRSQAVFQALAAADYRGTVLEGRG
ncbi:MAG: polyphosphate kinase 1 [Elusimicrobiota bacterium]